MKILVIALALLGLFSFIYGVIRNKRIGREKAEGRYIEEEIKEIDSGCCGQHEMCEKDSLLAAVSKEIEYFDDEELDRHRAKAEDEYTDDEVEEFREILYTTNEVEVAAWVRSLQLREINLPKEIKDEIYLIMGERRERNK